MNSELVMVWLLAIIGLAIATQINHQRNPYGNALWLGIGIIFVVVMVPVFTLAS